MIKAIVFDFNRTLFNPDEGALEEGAVGILEELSKKFLLGLLSKKGEGNRLELFNELGIRKFFKVVKVVEEKNEAIFMECVRELGVEPRETLAVGDQIKKDVKYSKALGCTTVWFRKGKFAEIVPENAGEEPDYTIRDLRELPSVVRSLSSDNGLV
ncbi:MAG: HAD family hydrolase [Candidatus Micrarchaeota archaeon]|nr:HAD family hydrolase [Candidatus Micrarchaeota archaeon]